MADIQVENGNYTRIHNEILETLMRTHLSPLEFKLVFAIFRKTYGFQKTNDIITASQFREMTGASRVAILSALDNLTRLKVITRESAGQMYRYGFNKYHEQWLPETFESRIPNRISNFGDKCKSKTGIPVEYQPDKLLNTSQAVETGIPVEYQTGKAVETGTGKAVEDTQKKSFKEILKETGRGKKSAPESPTLFPSDKNENFGKTKETSAFQDMFNILAETCHLDIKLNRGKIAGVSKKLIAAGYTAGDITGFTIWWKNNDWRGKDGQPPTLELIYSLIKQAKETSGGEKSKPVEPKYDYEPYKNENGEIKLKRILIS